MHESFPTALSQLNPLAISMSDSENHHHALLLDKEADRTILHSSVNMFL